MSEKRSKTFSYAIGMFGTSIPINMLKTYAAVFYVDLLGMSTVQLAQILFIYTFIDAIDNPVYGYLSDRTHSKWGRRRPWLVISTPLLVLCLIAFYNPPAQSSGNELFMYCLVFYILTGTIDSIINANYAALFPELFTTDESRAKTNAMRQAFQLVAMIISIALTPVVTNAIGYSKTSIIYGILGGIVIMYMSLSCKDAGIQPDEEQPKLWDSLKSLFINKKFWIAGFANAFYSAAVSLVLAAVPFFAKYTLGISAGQQTLLFGSVLLVAIGCVSIWAKMVKKYSVIPVWRAALLVLAVAFIPMYFANSLTSAIISGALVGFGISGVIVTMDLIGAKIIDEDRLKYNVRREGIISNALGFMNRLNGLFTSFAFYLVFVLFGFESGDNPGAAPDSAARFLLTVFPFILMVISFIFSFFIDFNKTKNDKEPISVN
ncbi:MAG TPA: MFS transporter [Anaerolineaceae bacterium]|nr:MFS transporter [Anaerolineaceae bacterium]